MFQNVYRQIGTVTGGASQVKSLDLPRKNFYSNLSLRLHSNYTITTLGSPVYRSWAPAHMLDRIEVIADGNDTIKSINARALLLKNFFNNGKAPIMTNDVLAADATNHGYVTLDLPFAMPRSVREIDTMLPSGKLSTFELRLTFGPADAIFSTVPTAYTNTLMEVDVGLKEKIPQDAKDYVTGVYKEMTLEKLITAVSSEFQFLLPVGNHYRGFLIECISDGIPVDTLITEFQIRSGTTVFYKGKWMQERERMASQLGMETIAFPGYTYVDFCDEGRLIDALDATKLSQLEFVAVVTHPGTTDTIRLYPDELILPRVA